VGHAKAKANKAHTHQDVGLAVRQVCRGDIRRQRVEHHDAVGHAVLADVIARDLCQVAVGFDGGHVLGAHLRVSKLLFCGVVLLFLSSSWSCGDVVVVIVRCDFGRDGDVAVTWW
jgi:hypothetical protein